MGHYNNEAWKKLGRGYPDSRNDAVARAIFDVLAPQELKSGVREPIYLEAPEEIRPNPTDVWKLAKECALAVASVTSPGVTRLT